MRVRIKRAILFRARLKILPLQSESNASDLKLRRKLCKGHLSETHSACFSERNLESRAKGMRAE